MCAVCMALDLVNFPSHQHKRQIPLCAYSTNSTTPKLHCRAMRAHKTYEALTQECAVPTAVASSRDLLTGVNISCNKLPGSCCSTTLHLHTVQPRRVHRGSLTTFRLTSCTLTELPKKPNELISGSASAAFYDSCAGWPGA